MRNQEKSSSEGEVEVGLLIKPRELIGGGEEEETASIREKEEI